MDTPVEVNDNKENVLENDTPKNSIVEYLPHMKNTAAFDSHSSYDEDELRRDSPNKKLQIPVLSAVQSDSNLSQ